MNQNVFRLDSLLPGDVVELVGGQVVVPHAPDHWVVRRFTVTHIGSMPYVQIEHTSGDNRRSGVFRGQLYGFVPGVTRYDPRRDEGLRISEIGLGPGCVGYIIVVSDSKHSEHEAAYYSRLRVIRGSRVIFGE